MLSSSRIWAVSKTMLIYIRHGDDEYADATYRDDKRITMKGWKEACQLGSLLLEKYGYPTRVYAGPLTRTLQTATALMSDVPDNTIYVDAKLSRFFSPGEQNDPDISLRSYPRTPIIETKAEFCQRVKEQFYKLIEETGEGEVVWCVTHAIVIREIGRLARFKTPSTIPFLDYYVVAVE
jgi:broad specificity phosphatase PhoE